MAEPHEHIDCREVVELVTDYFDGALGSDEAALFEQHLNFCDGCDSYVEQIRITVATLGRIAAPAVPEPVRDRLLAAFRDRGRS